MTEALRFRKKPVVIEASLLTQKNAEEVIGWINLETGQGSAWVLEHGVIVRTLEGDMHAEWGDWIIRGVKGEFYPCKPDIFEATYDKAE